MTRRLDEGETITALERREVVILAARPALTVTWSRYSGGERGPGLHVHREHTDAFYVLAGELTFAVGPGAERVTVAPGGFVAVPPGVVHTFFNDGGADASWLNLHAPDTGFAAFLRAARDGRESAWDSFDAPADGGLPAGSVIVAGPDVGDVLPPPGRARDPLSGLTPRAAGYAGGVAADGLAGIESVAVLGGGTMGGGIAGYLARAGLRVALVDASLELAEQARERLLERTQGHVDAGLLPTEATESTASVETPPDLEAAVGDADLVIEAVPERQALKEDILGRCSAAARATAVIASNTSSLPIGGLAPAVSEPGRFLGVHWFNPPEWTPGIEVIAASETSRETVERVVAFLRAIGKRPAEVADRAGFVSNRLQMALLREALACVEEGLATRESIDEVVRSTFGFRLPFFGPFLIADMAGLDTYQSVFETLEREVGPEFAAPAAVRELVEAGRLGTKSGKGFGDYTEAERERLLLERDRRYAALAKLLAELDDAG